MGPVFVDYPSLGVQSSSMVERAAVNRDVAGSSPASGAIRLGLSASLMAGHLRKAESNGPEQAPARRRTNTLTVMAYYVYILRLRNHQLYVGSTDDLARRVAEHQAGTACRTTALLGPVELMHSEPHPDRSSAIRRERQIKGWSRAKKLALIKRDLAELKRLAQCQTVHRAK